MEASEYKVWVDSNRHTFLQYRDSGKVRHFVTMRDGSIDLVQLRYTEYIKFKPCKSTPLQFAQIYLKSTLWISRSARAILRGVLGETEEKSAQPEAPSFSGGTVTLGDISQVLGKEPSACRKHLRKLVSKPGGRWAWTPEEAEKVVSMLRECFRNEDSAS